MKPARVAFALPAVPLLAALALSACKPGPVCTAALPLPTLTATPLPSLLPPSPVRLTVDLPAYGTTCNPPRPEGLSGVRFSAGGETLGTDTTAEVLPGGRTRYELVWVPMPGANGVPTKGTADVPVSAALLVSGREEPAYPTVLTVRVTVP